MNDPRKFFALCDMRYRFMQARESGFRTLFLGGIIMLPAGLLSLMTGITAYVITAGCAVCFGAVIASGLAYLKSRPHKAVVYYDRLVKGGECFPALFELMERNPQNRFYPLLLKECRQKHVKIMYPLVSGIGRFAVLPYLALAIILMIPAGMKSSGYSGLNITEPLHIPPTDYDTQAAQHSGADKDITGIPDDVSEDMLKALKEIAALLSNPDTDRAELESKIGLSSNDIISGRTEVSAELIKLLNSLNLSSSTGPGAGLYDSLKQADSPEEREMAAHRFRAYMNRFKDTGRRIELLIAMHSRGQDFRQGAIPEFSASAGIQAPGLQIAPGVLVPRNQLPDDLHTIIERYMQLRNNR